MATIDRTSTPGSENLIYLTNAMCEVAHASPALFAKHGLKGGSWEGEFYPLTDEEAKYIADDEVEVYDGFPALMGYSTVYEGKKYLTPTVEFCYGDEVETTEAEAREACEVCVASLAEKIWEVGGQIVVHEDMPDRINMLLMFPPEYAAEKAGGYEGWADHLDAEFFAAIRPIKAPAL